MPLRQDDERPTARLDPSQPPPVLSVERVGAGSSATNTTRLTWSDNSRSETGFRIQRATQGNFCSTCGNLELVPIEDLPPKHSREPLL